jgi:hypothetical protein
VLEGYRIEINPLAAATATRRSSRACEAGIPWTDMAHAAKPSREEEGDQRAVVGGGPPDAVRRGAGDQGDPAADGSAPGNDPAGAALEASAELLAPAAGVEARPIQGRGPPAARRRSSDRDPADPRALGGAGLRRRQDDRRRLRARRAPLLPRPRAPTSGRSTARGSCCSSTSGSRATRSRSASARRVSASSSSARSAARASGRGRSSSKDAPDILCGLWRCLCEIGGLPARLVCDREGALHSGGGRASEAFACFCGQLPVGLRIRDSGDCQAKGSSSSCRGSMATSFEPGQRFVNELGFHDQLDRWFSERANARSHRTLRERPIDRLARERLRPLPSALRTPTADWSCGCRPSPACTSTATTTRSTRASSVVGSSCGPPSAS